MRTCCCLPICQQRLWCLSAAGTHQFPQVWTLLEQDLCSSHGKELVPLTPTLLNGTQKRKRWRGRRGRERKLDRMSFLAHTFKTKQHCIMEIWLCSSDTRVMLTALKNRYGCNSSAFSLVHFSSLVFYTKKGCYLPLCHSNKQNQGFAWFCFLFIVFYCK